MHTAVKHILKISTDFSTTPGARYYSDGDDSGQKFYERKLKQAFEDAVADDEVLTIDLDGTEGYATSFLDEAFNRLAKDFGKEKVRKHIEIVSTEEPDWVEEIFSYIDEAE